MGANELLLHLRESGFSISMENSRLQIAPADKLTNEIKQTIRQSKAEILTELKKEVLRDLVLEVMVLVSEPPANWQYHVDLALADHDDAMTCYSALKRELQQNIKEN